MAPFDWLSWLTPPIAGLGVSKLAGLSRHTLQADALLGDKYTRIPPKSACPPGVRVIERMLGSGRRACCAG